MVVTTGDEQSQEIREGTERVDRRPKEEGKNGDQKRSNVDWRRVNGEVNWKQGREIQFLAQNSYELGGRSLLGSFSSIRIGFHLQIRVYDGRGATALA
jgi:hypothetical protein